MIFPKKAIPLLFLGAALVLPPASSEARPFDVRHRHHPHWDHGRGYARTGFSIGLGFSPSYQCPSPGYYGGYYPSHYANSLEMAVQRELARRGYYHGAIDGVIGPRSRTAIRAFQAHRGLVVTGVIDTRLLRALGLS